MEVIAEQNSVFAIKTFYLHNITNPQNNSHKRNAWKCLDKNWLYWNKTRYSSSRDENIKRILTL